jgi:hypothetical protein
MDEITRTLVASDCSVELFLLLWVLVVVMGLFLGGAVVDAIFQARQRKRGRE